MAEVKVEEEVVEVVAVGRKGKLSWVEVEVVEAEVVAEGEEEEAVVAGKKGTRKEPEEVELGIKK